MSSEKKKTKLYIATQDYPYGTTAERVFVESELKYLSEEFDITIFSHARAKNKAVKCEVPNGVEVIDIPANMDIGFKDMLRYGLRFLFDRDAYREIANILKSGSGIFKRIYESMGFYILAMKDYDCIKAYILDEEGIYYSFWYFYFCYSMTHFKQKYPKLKLVTRTHGHELYEERYIGGRQPFKIPMDEKLDRIVFAAEYAKNYYVEHYGKSNSDSKYELSRLGVEKEAALGSDASEKNREDKDKYDFHLVSCSSLLGLKRVDLIISGLSRILDKKIKWVHFGDGPLREELEEQARLFLKDNIDYSFFGNVENHTIHEYYMNNRPDCFITTSSTEGGCPVSIQEAYAYGIPAIGTSCGGITEMIDDTGILLSENPDADEVAVAIRKMADMPEEEKNKLSLSAVKLWEKSFNAGNNARHMIDILKSL